MGVNMSRRKKNRFDYQLILYFFLIVYVGKVILENLWILIIPVIAIVVISYIKRQSKKELIRKYQTIDSLLERYRGKETDFEFYIAQLYELLGYKVKVTPPVNDGGKDIVLWRNSLKAVVEVKLYAKSNKVSRPMIQKLHSAMIDCEANEAIFVTTSDFTEPAIRYAVKFNIQTVDGNELVKLIDRVNKLIK
jgi:restriction system protein